jgi:hypothetical protein
MARTWRTPDAPSSGGVRTRRLSIGKGHQIVLAEQAEHFAKNWKTPHGMGGTDRHGVTAGGGGEFAKQAMNWARMWPTVVKGDHRSSVTGAIAKRNARPLCEVVSRFSLPGLTTSKAGADSLEATRKLNPLFVELLMGLPLGWTDYAPLGMESFRWWLRSHSERLRDVWELMHSSGLLDPA